MCTVLLPPVVNPIAGNKYIGFVYGTVKKYKPLNTPISVQEKINKMQET